MKTETPKAYPAVWRIKCAIYCWRWTPPKHWSNSAGSRLEAASAEGRLERVLEPDCHRKLAVDLSL